MHGEGCKFCHRLAIEIPSETHPSGRETVVNHHEKCPRNDHDVEARYDRGYRDACRYISVKDGAYADDMAYQSGWVDGDAYHDTLCNPY